MTRSQTLSLQASDVSGQKHARVRNCPADCSVDELMLGLLDQMKLPKNDPEGRPVNYQAVLEREGRALHGSETVGEALQDDDRIVLQPNVDAG